MSVLAEVVERYGWLKVETASIVWAGRMRRDEAGCPSLVAAWRRAVAEVVCIAIARQGLEGLRELTVRTVGGIEATPIGVDALDHEVARWSRLVAVLDSRSGAPSTFPQTVLAASDLAEIAEVAHELDAERRRRV